MIELIKPSFERTPEETLRMARAIVSSRDMFPDKAHMLAEGCTEEEYDALEVPAATFEHTVQAHLSVINAVADALEKVITERDALRTPDTEPAAPVLDEPDSYETAAGAEDGEQARAA